MLKTRVVVRDGESSRTVSALEAVLLGLFKKGAHGNSPAARTFFELVQTHFPPSDTDEADTSVAAEDRAVIEAFLRRHGLQAELPAPIPSPAPQQESPDEET